MNDLPKSDLLRFVERAVELASRAVARHSPNILEEAVYPSPACRLALSESEEDHHVPRLVDELIEMPRIRDALDLDSIPAPSTLCKAFGRLEMAGWRVLLNVSLADLPVNGVIGIDASGFERAHISTHYTKRTLVL